MPHGPGVCAQFVGAPWGSVSLLDAAAYAAAAYLSMHMISNDISINENHYLLVVWCQSLILVANAVHV